MESPSATGDTKKVVARSSIVDSLHGYGLSGMRIDKDDLKKQLTMPQYLRFTMRDSIRLQDPTAGESRYWNRVDGEDALLLPVPWLSSSIPSGGRHGPALKERLQQLMSEEQVAGGDGSVGWVLSCLTELHSQGREPVPPVGIIPLGTCNDLSRSFHWVCWQRVAISSCLALESR